MTRIALLLYAAISYAIGMAGLVVFMLYVGGWGWPFEINADPTVPVGVAVAINFALLSLFGLQHSVMARRAFKQQLTLYVPSGVERSTYVLLSGVVTFVLCWAWQPIGGMLWEVEWPVLRVGLLALQIAGWTMAVVSSFMINHFELFGLQQTMAHAAGREAPTPVFVVRFGYHLVRHPLQFGILVGMWSTPAMSMTHLLLVMGMTAYILLGLALEERDLVRQFGQQYLDYQQRVPMLVPSFRRA